MVELQALGARNPVAGEPGAGVAIRSCAQQSMQNADKQRPLQVKFIMPAAEQFLDQVGKTAPLPQTLENQGRTNFPACVADWLEPAIKAKARGENRLQDWMS